MRRLHHLFLLLLVTLLTGCTEPATPSPPIPKQNQWYPVAGYIDGDAFKIKIGEDEAMIRLLYIDTPKSYNPEADAEPYGQEAFEFTKQLLADSKEVRLTYDKEYVDSGNRILAIVELKDGSILNELLIQEGLAKVLILEPNVKMENVYKQLEQQAKQAQLGLWSSGTEVSHSDVPIKKVAPTGIVIEVDKETKLVTISNTTRQAVDLEGWKLVSVRDNQTYMFEPYMLEPQEKVHIASGKQVEQAPASNVLLWEASDLWHSSHLDSAELYDDNKELIAIWEDN